MIDIPVGDPHIIQLPDTFGFQKRFDPVFPHITHCAAPSVDEVCTTFRSSEEKCIPLSNIHHIDFQLSRPAVREPHEQNRCQNSCISGFLLPESKTCQHDGQYHIVCQNLHCPRSSCDPSRTRDLQHDPASFFINSKNQTAYSIGDACRPQSPRNYRSSQDPCEAACEHDSRKRNRKQIPEYGIRTDFIIIIQHDWKHCQLNRQRHFYGAFPFRLPFCLPEGQNQVDTEHGAEGQQESRVKELQRIERQHQQHGRSRRRQSVVFPSRHLCPHTDQKHHGSSDCRYTPSCQHRVQDQNRTASSRRKSPCKRGMSQDFVYSHPDKRHMKTRDRQQMPDSAFLIVFPYLLIHIRTVSEHHGAQDSALFFAEIRKNLLCRFLPNITHPFKKTVFPSRFSRKCPDFFKPCLFQRSCYSLFSIIKSLVKIPRIRGILKERNGSRHPDILPVFRNPFLLPI